MADDKQKGFASKTQTLQQQFDAEMTRRKFSAQVIEKAELTVIDAAEATEQVGFSWPQSIRIPYFDLSGKPIDFVRLRRLVDDGQRRYTQRRSSGTHVYFPPLDNWAAIAKDTTVPIVITEGEFKALTVMATGAACLGLAGVTSWGSQTGKPLHDELLPFQWRDRQVHIIFDYDGHKHPNEEREPNAQVQRQEQFLSVVLKGLGAKVRVCRVGLLAPSTEQKYAIDDHLKNGGTLAELLEKVAVDLTVHDEKTAMYEFGTQYAFLNGKIIRLSDGLVMSFLDAKHDTGNITCQVNVAAPNAPPKMKSFKVIERFDGWEKRTKIKAVGMFPRYQGQKITPEGYFNTFENWAYQPVKGDVTPYLELCKHFFQDEPHFEEFWHNWIAQILQKPWERNNTTVQLVSPLEGVGKSFMGEMPAKLVGMRQSGKTHDEGRHYGACTTGPDKLFGNWTSFLEGKVLVLVNEPSSDNTRHSNKLKDFITGDTVNINKKYGGERDIENYVNYVFTTNRIYVTKMSKHARREGIYAPRSLEPKDMNRRCTELSAWLEAGGFSHVMHWYLDRDLSGYNRSIAPDTKAKRDAIALSATDLEDVVDAFYDFVAEKCDGAVLMTAEMRNGVLKEMGLSNAEGYSGQAINRAIATRLEVGSKTTAKDHGKNVNVLPFTKHGMSVNNVQMTFDNTVKMIEKWWKVKFNQ